MMSRETILRTLLHFTPDGLEISDRRGECLALMLASPTAEEMDDRAALFDGDAVRRGLNLGAKEGPVATPLQLFHAPSVQMLKQGVEASCWLGVHLKLKVCMHV